MSGSSSLWIFGKQYSYSYSQNDDTRLEDITLLPIHREGNISGHDCLLLGELQICTNDSYLSNKASIQ